MGRASDHPSDETLAAFLDGNLGEGEREAVIGHLAQCDDCRAFVADWGRAVALESAGKRGAVSERVGKLPAEGNGVVRVKPEAVNGRAEGGRFCPVCRRRVTVEGGFCPYCGSGISEGSISCGVCGRKIGDGDTYCRHCGTPLKADAVSREAAGQGVLYEYGSLVAGIVCFVISFFVPRFFWQFLIAFAAFEGFYVYFRLKREVLLKLIEAFRSGDKGKEEEVLQRLRRRFKA